MRNSTHWAPHPPEVLLQAHLRRPGKGNTREEKLKKASRKRKLLLTSGPGEGQWTEAGWSGP